MIRLLEPRDVSICVDLVCTNFGDAAAFRFHEEVDHVFNSGMQWPPIYFVAEVDGAVAGFAGMMESWLMNGVWDLIWINVHPDHQGKGIGQALTEHRMQYIREHNGSAIHLMTRQYEFFKKFGFHAAHVYAGGWILMVKQLRELKV